MSMPLTRPSASVRPGAAEYRARARERRPGSHSLFRTLLLVFPPVFLLTLYLVLCTTAVRSGHYRNQLEAQIRKTRDEIDVLQVEVRRLESPGRIFAAAERLGMQRPEQVAFAEAPVPRQYASAGSAAR